MIILGIDPGTATTGYGIIELKKNQKKPTFIACGCIKTFPQSSPEERLKKIYNELNKLIGKYRPNVLVVEKLFFFKNAKTAMPVSQARGVILLAGAKKKLPIYEFTPLEVKMNIVGYGRAQKIQIQKMIKLLLDLNEIPRPDDAADALGLALCCANLVKVRKSG